MSRFISEGISVVETWCPDCNPAVPTLLIIPLLRPRLEAPLREFSVGCINSSAGFIENNLRCGLLLFQCTFGLQLYEELQKLDDKLQATEVLLDNKVCRPSYGAELVVSAVAVAHSSYWEV